MIVRRTPSSTRFRDIGTVPPSRWNCQSLRKILSEVTPSLSNFMNLVLSTFTLSPFANESASSVRRALRSWILEFEYRAASSAESSVCLTSFSLLMASRRSLGRTVSRSGERLFRR